MVDTGLYALCRHPGVIFFFLAYLCMAFAAGSDLMFWAHAGVDGNGCDPRVGAG